MTGKIFLRNLEIETIVGILPHERNTPRKVVINLAVECDMYHSFSSDNLQDSVDYRIIRDNVVNVVKEASDFLIERLACRVADVVLEIGGVNKVTVTIDKPGALQSCDSVAVEITRKKWSE